MQVWILSEGEDHEGGFVIGVYAEKDFAQNDFLSEANKIHESFTLDDAVSFDDGTIRVHGGCDWLVLEPFEVKGSLELESASEDN